MAERSIKVIDTTLRDGEQTPGVSFTSNEKMDIAKELSELGVDMIEVGIAAMGPEEIETIRNIHSMQLKAELLVWNRMTRADIDMSLKTGINQIHISVPSSDIHLSKKMGISRDTLLIRIRDTIGYANSKGLMVSIGAEDASRADLDFLKKLYEVAESEGINRVRYADTLGVLSPFQTFDIINALSKTVSVPLDFHGHNDLGMGTANALAAYKAGAQWVSCSVNGLGERAGNTPLEEIIVALTYLEGAKTKIDRKKFMQVSRKVALYSGKKLYDLKPIVGKNIFSHESGIHVDGIIKDALTYEVIVPEDYGRRREIIIGKYSGRHAIQYKMKEWGYEIDEIKAQEIVDLIRKFTYDHKLNDQALMEIIFKCIE